MQKISLMLYVACQIASLVAYLALCPSYSRLGGSSLQAALVDLLQSAWLDIYAPNEWRNAQLVVPKKGDLSRCDNWRGIALLEVVGKLCGRIIQDRLQSVLEDEVPESQCGFRAGRGCPNAVFCARQLIEKSYEHRTKICLVFIDLRKAYDSVPRAALWVALEKLGSHQL